MIILVVDDDRLVRFTVKSMLISIMKEEYLFLEAANGKDMVEICMKNRPDIVFADIKMPYMNGLDAIAECKKYTDKTEFVIISGYSDFKYAKTGITLGVYEYLLKPIEEEQVKKVVTKLTEKLEKNKSQSNSEFQLKLLYLFNYFSTVGTTEEYEEFTLPKKLKYSTFGLFMNNVKCNNKSVNMEKKILGEFRKLGEEAIARGEYFALIYSNEGTPYFVFAVSKDEEERMISRIKKYDIQQLTEKGAMLYHFTCKYMKQLYETAEKLDNVFWMGMNYTDIKLLDYNEMLLSDEGKAFLCLVQSLLTAWNNAEGVEYKEILNKMYQKYKYKELDINLKHVAAYCSLVTGQQIDSSSYKEFYRSFTNITDEMYENVSAEESNLIDQIKQYMQKNYMNDISISQIAECYHLTPNYLSTVFHSKAGCKFIDYITEIRILNAKKLLVQNPSASIQDIAVMVGYVSSRHFSTVFQKQTGITPTTYRKNCRI